MPAHIGLGNTRRTLGTNICVEDNMAAYYIPASYLAITGIESVIETVFMDLNPKTRQQAAVNNVGVIRPLPDMQPPRGSGDERFPST